MSLQKSQIEPIEKNIEDVLRDVRKLILLVEIEDIPENQRTKAMKLRDKLVFASCAAKNLKGVCT